MLHLDREQLIGLLDRQPLFRTIGAVADNLDRECYVVGGYVRDLFLERPSNDIDVVVVGSGIDVAKALANRIGRRAHLSVFRNFGTAQVKFGATEVEFVGARRESYSHDSRKPIVEDGTLEDDQRRRDFTINALAICLNASRFGELVDPFDGVWDMEDRIIATPLDPDITFSDDPLRMMRCVRFATQLSFTIEPETFEALTRNRDRIKIVSAERITDELQKIMASDAPRVGLELLADCGLLEIIFPELIALQGIDNVAGRAHKDNFWHTLEVLTNIVQSEDKEKLNASRAPKATGRRALLGNSSSLGMAEAQPKEYKLQERGLWLRWAALLHDIGKPRTKRFDPATGWTFHNHNSVGAHMVPAIFRRMKLPLDERMHYVQKLVELHMRPIAIADDEVTDSAVRRLLFEAGDDIDDLMLLCEADITSRNRQRKQHFLDNFRLVRQKLVDLEERDRIRCFQPPVSGEEIMETFNLQPSKEVGILKNAVKDAILDGLIRNEHDAAMLFVRNKAAELGIAPV